jgi:hypothetical protein
MSARKRTYDYVISTVAGAAVILVAAFPTGRSFDDRRFETGPTSCAVEVGPPACNAVQATLGEHIAERVHVAAAGVFVAMLVALCVVFALREFGYGPGAKQLCGPDRDVHCVYAAVKKRRVSLARYLVGGLPDVGTPLDRAPAARAPRRRVLLYLALALLVLLGGIWAALGPNLTLPAIGLLGKTYIGEVIAFVSFGLAWLTASQDLRPVRRAAEAIKSTMLGQGQKLSGVLRIQLTRSASCC